MLNEFPGRHAIEGTVIVTTGSRLGRSDRCWHGDRLGPGRTGGQQQAAGKDKETHFPFVPGREGTGKLARSGRHG